MSPETEKQVNEAIDWLQQVGGSVQDFAVEQAPLYCREVVAWTLWVNVAQVALSVLLIALGGAFIWKNKSRIGKAFEEMELAYPAAAIISSVVMVTALIGGCESAACAIKAAVAPRLVIVEHLRGLK